MRSEIAFGGDMCFAELCTVQLQKEKAAKCALAHREKEAGIRP